jgi:hypothetical protein
VDLANLGSGSETCVGSCVRLVGSLSPSRRIFIGSHSLPPSPVRRIGPSSGIRAPSDGENLKTSKTTLEGLVTLVVK